MGEAKPVDNDVTELVERLRSDILKKICESGVEKCPSSDAKIVVNNYKTQVVSGTNYFVGLVLIFGYFEFYTLRIVAPIIPKYFLLLQCHY